MFFCTIGVASTLTVIRIAIPNTLNGPTQSGKPQILSSDQSWSSKPQNYRPITLPKSTFTPNVTRSEYNRFPLVDMNDRGDYLFLENPRAENFREYIHIFSGKEIRSGLIPSDHRWLLTRGGNILKRTAPSRNPMYVFGKNGGGRSTSGPYNDLRFMTRYEDDGAFINFRYVATKRKHLSTLEKDFVDGHTEVFYQTPHQADLLDIGDDGSNWIRQSNSIDTISARIPSSRTSCENRKVSGLLVWQPKFHRTCKNVYENRQGLARAPNSPGVHFFLCTKNLQRRPNFGFCNRCNSGKHETSRLGWRSYCNHKRYARMAKTRQILTCGERNAPR